MYSVIATTGYIKSLFAVFDLCHLRNLVDLLVPLLLLASTHSCCHHYCAVHPA